MAEIQGANSVNVCITGGAGFVGRHLTRRLLDLGYEVSVVDSICEGTGGINPEIGWPLFDPRDYESFKFYKLDCREFFKYTKASEFDYVFHLAAYVGGRLAIEKRPIAVAEDLSIDAALWKWVVESNPGKIINFSSSAAYPVTLQLKEGEVILLKENMITFDGLVGMPDMTYGWAKLTNEYLGRLAHKHYGIKSIVYRPFSGYGPDQDLTYPFPSICKRALSNMGEKKLEVWGSGKQARDFIFIEDCISGILKTMDKIEDGSPLNLSTGVPTSFIDLATEVCAAIGYYPEIYGNTNFPSGVASRCGDIQKQIDFGFNERTSLKKGIEMCLEFLSNYS